MKRHYPYLIVGGGIAADAAARGIRQFDESAAIGLVGEEPDPPYNRPPLSKGLWKTVPRPMPISRIWRGTAGLGVDLHLNRRAVHLAPLSKQVLDDQGDEYTYEKLLLATGGEPIQPWPDHERLVPFRTLGDYHQLRALAGQHQRFAVIGGGFIGSEIAAALANQGKEVVMLFPESGICARVLPGDISAFLNRVFQERGVRVLSGRLVTQVTAQGGGLAVWTGQGEEFQADGVIAGLGIRPRVELALSAGLETGNGIRVNSHLQTSHPDIYAAGDVANFYSPILGVRMRAEHEENANLQGLLAGQNMAGQSGTYEAVPSVYSTLFDLSYDAVGILDPRMQIVYDWREPYRSGAVYYLEDNRVRGVLLWNLPKGLDAAREILSQPGPLTGPDLLGRIP